MARSDSAARHLARGFVMETVSMLIAGVILFTAIYGLSGMIVRRPLPRGDNDHGG